MGANTSTPCHGAPEPTYVMVDRAAVAGGRNTSRSTDVGAFAHRLPGIRRSTSRPIGADTTTVRSGRGPIRAAHHIAATIAFERADES